MGKWLKLRHIDGKRVSFAWYLALTAARKAGVRYLLTSGKRFMSEQRALFAQNMQFVGGRWVPKPGHPLTAKPSITAPHIRKGSPAHAIDVNSLDGGETRLEAWLERHDVDVTNPVPGEAWHMEVPLSDLLRLARVLLKRDEEARKAALAKHARKRAAKRRARKTKIARENGAHFASIIYDACLERKLPYSLGLAICQQETGFENEYGHDALPGQRSIWHGQPSNVKVLVTEANSKRYMSWAATHGLRQGVGPMQLTSETYQKEAMRRGGIWKPEVTIPYGLEILDGHIDALGTDRGIGAYNGGRGRPNMAYAADVKRLWTGWRRLLH